MSPIDAGTARGFRDRPLGKVAILAAILLVALLASRSCADSGGKVDQAEAVEIAKRQVDYEAERVQVRFFRQGIPSVGFWAVSLTGEERAAVRRTLVIIHAGTGRVDKVDEVAP